MEQRELYQRLILGGLVCLMKHHYLASKEVSLGEIQ